MERSLAIATPRLGTTRHAVSGAEQSGFDRAWLTEYADRDALIRAAIAATGTERLGIATGIAYVFTRHPLALAVAALDVHEASSGRFVLGLGTGTGGMRARWYGTPSDRPASLLRETAEFLRAAWNSSSGLTFDGNFYSAHVDGLDLLERYERLPPLQIFGSGLGEGMLRVSLRHLDGVLLHPLALGEKYIQRVLEPALEAGTQSRSTLPKLVQWVLVSLDDNERTARRAALGSLAFYLATPSYDVYFDGTPWAQAQAEVATQFRSGNRDLQALSDLIPDAMADEYTVWGTAQTVAQRLTVVESRLAERGVSEVVLQAVSPASIGEAEEIDGINRLLRLTSRAR